MNDNDPSCVCLLAGSAVSFSTTCPWLPDIYFLMNGETVQYVGRTRNLDTRVRVHKGQGIIPFGYVRYIVTDGDANADKAVERRLVRHFKPLYNIRLNPTHSSAWLASLTRRTA